ncbi:MAG: transporter substrate-binding domain-containing protein [Burkholderiaceae bacterium]|nr:transporter substrate-binding domain-containing protein [Burkholderiaceae bacterium]
MVHLKKIFLALLLYLFPLGFALCNPTLKLVANEWPPYTSDHVSGKGTEVEHVRRMLSKAGYDTTIEIVPWARALQLVYAGQADGIIAIWSTDERRQKIAFSEAYSANTLRLYSVKGKSRKILSIKDLAGQIIAVGRAYEYSDEFLKMNNFRKEAGVGTLHDIQKLIKGRVDAVLEDEQIFRYYVENNFSLLGNMDEFDASPAIMVLPLYFGITRKRPDAQRIIENFNQILAREKMLVK